MDGEARSDGHRGSSRVGNRRGGAAAEDDGQYRLLSDYLYRRHADTIVLTFAEIEDLLGFRLPEQAWNQPEWWTSRDPSSASHADAWTLARRTAVPNLLARTVVFDRAC